MGTHVGTRGRGPGDAHEETQGWARGRAWRHGDTREHTGTCTGMGTGGRAWGHRGLHGGRAQGWGHGHQDTGTCMGTRGRSQGRGHARRHGAEDTGTLVTPSGGTRRGVSRGCHGGSGTHTSAATHVCAALCDTRAVHHTRVCPLVSHSCVSPRTGPLRRIRALARWRRGEGGGVPAPAFMALAHPAVTVAHSPRGPRTALARLARPFQHLPDPPIALHSPCTPSQHLAHPSHTLAHPLHAPPSTSRTPSTPRTTLQHLPDPSSALHAPAAPHLALAHPLHAPPAPHMPLHTLPSILHAPLTPCTTLAHLS